MALSVPTIGYVEGMGLPEHLIITVLFQNTHGPRELGVDFQGRFFYEYPLFTLVHVNLGEGL